MPSKHNWSWFARLLTNLTCGWSPQLVFLVKTSDLLFFAWAPNVHQRHSEKWNIDFVVLSLHVHVHSIWWSGLFTTATTDQWCQTNVVEAVQLQFAAISIVNHWKKCNHNYNDLINFMHECEKMALCTANGLEKYVIIIIIVCIQFEANWSIVRSIRQFIVIQWHWTVRLCALSTGAGHRSRHTGTCK